MSLKIQKTLEQHAQQVIVVLFIVIRVFLWITGGILQLQFIIIFILRLHYLYVLFILEYLVERLSGLGTSFNKTVDGYNSYLDNKNGKWILLKKYRKDFSKTLRLFFYRCRFLFVVNNPIYTST